ncbi:chaplin [Streptomyces sp. LP11]|uniref:Chaplin n=1 Tax=Streptomyces pyxinicus TaxID=2970331 RepID=A0ABT2B2U4_9ACTN|nr:chaplin [Streptomyces sp. LP11]MCS0602812.1 chaplin [Streptomyces sp. LP11]
MNRVTRNSLIAIAAASGAMAVAGPVYADSAADGTAVGSPGAVSGNTLQLPVSVPVNACGNTVNVVGLLNPAFGNRCANVGHGGSGKGHSAGSSTSGGATAQSGTHGSAGVISGNGVQLPVDLPVNVSGNTVDVVGIGNPVFGNTSVNESHPRPEPTKPAPPRHVEPPAKPHTPPVKHTAPPKPAPVVEHQTVDTLAHTGAGNPWAPAAMGAVSLLGGTLLYRRFRTRTARQEA